MKSTSRERVTIKTVAKEANVSVAVVSRVLRNAYGVSDQMRTHVQQAIEKLSYRPHTGARSLRGKTYTVGVLFPDMRNPFFADLQSGICEALERTEFSELQAIGDHSAVREQHLTDSLIDRGSDGLILIAPRLTKEQLEVIATKAPLVLIGYHHESERFDTVNNDDYTGARLAVRHLQSRGYRRIAFITLDLQGFPSEPVTVTRRRQGYCDEMVELGLSNEIRVVETPELTRRELRFELRQLLLSPRRPDAVFCWTDWVALEVLSIARELNLPVPDSLGVVGHDNTSYCDLTQNSLTSIDQSGQTLGLQAVRLLLERINGRAKSEHYYVAPRLVARASSRPTHAGT